MDKRTLLAVVLSVVVITLGFMLQTVLFPPPEVAITGDSSTVNVPTTSAQRTTAPVSSVAAPAEAPLLDGVVLPVPTETSMDSALHTLFLDGFLRATFDPRGGTLSSLRLMQHLDQGEPVEMVFGPTDGTLNGLTMAFGGFGGEPIDALFFRRENPNPNIVEYYRDFYVSGVEDQSFRVTRRYRFEPGEYLLQMDIVIEYSDRRSQIPLNFDNMAYTISFGPQIGPQFVNLSGRNDSRRFVSYASGSRKNYGLSNGVQVGPERISWAAIDGKYFSVFGVPGGNVEYQTRFTTELVDLGSGGTRQGSQMHFSRPLITNNPQTDTYRFYVGPKIPSVLQRYNRPDDNTFQVRDMDFDKIADTNILGWLEDILKAIMQLFYNIVPNWGVAIILLTILVKALLFPLTKKSSDSIAKQGALGPKMQEIREKFKDNQTKMNQEIAELYKKEGVNPLGGCLPMLLQFPFFIAMFGLFNNHFDLRGAVFIPGWINDLSAPESILNFGSFTLPLLGWNDLRLLPILYVGTQLLSSKLMQSPGAAGTSKQNQMMMYLLPLVFFFILYDMPSGLLVYWIFQNILTVGQQQLTNALKKKQNSK